MVVEVSPFDRTVCIVRMFGEGGWGEVEEMEEFGILVGGGKARARDSKVRCSTPGLEEDGSSILLGVFLRRAGVAVEKVRFQTFFPKVISLGESQ